MSPLTETEMKRYSRQIVYPEIGLKGQEKLSRSWVAVLGIGGLGSIASLYLALAGVNLRLIDRDIVELNNLQRQILYREEDIGKPKATAAKENLQKWNSSIQIESFVEDFNPDNAEELIVGVDLVVDGTDNFEARYLLNDVCVKHGIPFMYSAAIGTRGMMSFIVPGETPCLTCLFTSPPRPGSLETCETAGVIGPSPGVMGVIEAAEAIKYLAGFGENLKNKLLIIDLTDNSFEVVRVKKNPGCNTCADRNFAFLSKKERTRYVVALCGRASYQVRPKKKLNLNLTELSHKLSRIPEIRVVRVSDEVAIMTYDGKEVTLFRSGRIILKGARDEKEAVSIASRFFTY